MDYLQSELINNGHKEFFNNNNLSFFDSDFLFMQKVLKCDDDILKILNERIFINCQLETLESDIIFKRMFVTKFMNRQISSQTIEGFTSLVIHTFFLNKHFIDNVFDNLQDFVTGKSTSENEETGSDNNTTDTVNNNRFLESDLPQNKANSSLDDPVLLFANKNNISKNKETSIQDGSNKSNSKSLTNNYNIDTLLKSNQLLNEVFNDFDKRCFLQIW